MLCPLVSRTWPAAGFHISTGIAIRATLARLCTDLIVKASGRTQLARKPFSIAVSSWCTILLHPFPAYRARLAVKTILWTKRFITLDMSTFWTTTRGAVHTKPSLLTRRAACSRSKRKLSWGVDSTSLFSAIANTEVPGPTATTPRFGDRV